MFTANLSGVHKAGLRNSRGIGAVNRRKTPAGVIWSLHRVITNPESPTIEVVAAKQRLLRILHEPLSSIGAPVLESKPVQSRRATKVRASSPGRARSRTGTRGAELAPADPPMAEGLAS